MTLFSSVRWAVPTAPRIAGALGRIWVPESRIRRLGSGRWRFHLAFGLTDGIFASSDRGDTWLQATTAMTLEQATVLSVAVPQGFGDHRTALAATDGLGVLRSTNGGLYWEFANQGLEHQQVWVVVTSPGFAADQTALAATSGGGVYRSVDGGQTWAVPGTALDGYDIWALAISPDYGHDRTLLASGEAPGGEYVSFRSTDGGGSWMPIGGDLPDRSVWWWAFSPNYADDDTIFAGTSAYGVLVSTDDGGTWGFLSAGLFGKQEAIWMVTPSPEYANDRVVFAGTLAGCWQTPKHIVYLPLITRDAPTGARQSSISWDPSVFRWAERRSSGTRKRPSLGFYSMGW